MIRVIKITMKVEHGTCKIILRYDSFPKKLTFLIFWMDLNVKLNTH